MSKQEVEGHIERIVNTYSQRFRDCTPRQVQTCAAAFLRLMEELDPSKALVIADVFLQEIDSINQNALDWLIGELYFEVYVVVLDDRAEAAIHFLKHRSAPDINNQSLDRYNARLARFKG